jgi:hypothetical protein
VRGDRHATGGIRKPKLSEAELEARMAAIQIKNASLTAAHARAEADAASFAEREEAARAATSIQAEQKRKVERRDRQQMMGERERNRMRKLKVMGGREWDSEKREEDFERGGVFDGRGREFKGDAADYTDGREYLLREPRGGGGGQRGRGRGRGGGGKGQAQGQERVVAVPKQEDFPALPPVGRNSDVAVAAGGKSWADQVESVDTA